MNPDEITADARKLREALSILPEPVVRATLVLVSGLPGTGKSHFSRRLAEKLPSAIVESDALRRKLFQDPTYSVQESQRLFSACHALIEGLLSQGISVILDATNLAEHHREPLYRIAGRVGAKLIVVQVEAPGELVRHRLKLRAEGIDPLDKSDAGWDVYQKMKTRTERIRRNYFSVDTSRDITPVVDKIVREARR